MRHEVSPLTEAAAEMVRSAVVVCDGNRVSSWSVRRGAPGWRRGGCAS